MNRIQYFGWMVVSRVVFTIIVAAFANPYTAEITVIEGLCMIGAVIVSLALTAERCKDIGIHEANCFWVLIPFVWLYFVFKRGRQYYAAHAYVCQ